MQFVYRSYFTVYLSFFFCKNSSTIKIIIKNKINGRLKETSCSFKHCDRMRKREQCSHFCAMESSDENGRMMEE